VTLPAQMAMFAPSQLGPAVIVNVGVAPHRAPLCVPSLAAGLVAGLALAFMLAHRR
jgi:hypothetical protein